MKDSRIKSSSDVCSECGEHWDCATFLSETFNYSGGNMVFQCQCGNTKTRMFLPTDLMPVDQVFKYVMKQEGIDEEIIESAVTQYKAQQRIKELTKS